MQPEIEISTLDEWITYVFDHPVNHLMPEWYFDDTIPFWNETGHLREVVGYLSRAFETIEQVIVPYSDAQLNQALWFLTQNGASQHMHALWDATVPLPDRLRCVRSFYNVFERVYAPRCTPHLGHRMTQWPDDMNPLNSSCYMWWDELAPYGQTEREDLQAIGAEMIGVMERTLALESDACRESALHGLGHAHGADSEHINRIIDAFLARHPALRPELRQYALSARGGCVL